MSIPLDQLQSWLNDELVSGAPKPQQAVLSTIGMNNAAHARVVAIREIDERGLLFFTQRGTRKVEELNHHPQACMTFWFELYQREVIIEGNVRSLTQAENENYWLSYPREAQIRFCSYAPTSSRPITSKLVLEEKRRELERDFANQLIPFNSYYCGFRLLPTRIIFYAYRADELSDVCEYMLAGDRWTRQSLSP